MTEEQFNEGKKWHEKVKKEGIGKFFNNLDYCKYLDSMYGGDSYSHALLYKYVIKGLREYWKLKGLDGEELEIVIGTIYFKIKPTLIKELETLISPLGHLYKK